MLYVDDVWVVVCDASRAIVYKSQGKVASLLFVKKLEHEESRAHVHDLVSDRQGRTQQSVSGGGHTSVGHGSRSGMQKAHSPKELEHEQFAIEIAAELTTGLSQQAYSHLVLIASPHFLGLLRSKLDEHVGKKISHTVDKDYTHLTSEELHQRLVDTFII